MKNGWAIGSAAIIAIALLVAYLVYAGDTQGSTRTASSIGSRVPALAVPSLSGKSMTLRDFDGDVVLVNLWASWCPPCRAEMPDLQRLWNTNRSRHVAIVGINEGESPQRAHEFADALGVRFPVLVDEEQRFGRTYAALGLPTSVLIDRHGVVLRTFDGALTYAQMQSALDGALSAK